MNTVHDPLLKNKKILIIHFRVGKTDGVSLEIEAWKEIFESKGANVMLLSGPENNGADFVIKDLEQQLNPQIFTIDEDAFGGLKTFESKDALNKAILEMKNKLKDEFVSVLTDCRPDYVLVSNIFSVGENIPSAAGLDEALKEFRLPTLLVNHDFYWENVRYLDPTTGLIEDMLEKYFPPKRGFYTYFVINKIAQKELLNKKGIKAEVLNDTFDFDRNGFTRSKKIDDLFTENSIDINDIILLQATRIVRRKNIEIAIDLVKAVNNPKRLNKLRSVKLNGKPFDPNRNKAILLLSGYAEHRNISYMKELLRYAGIQGIELHLLRGFKNNSTEKINMLWDTYAYADVVTYPSEYEGFGNQFLEAVFAGKPVAVFEYPVFHTDIKPKGFDYISLGSKIERRSGGLLQIPEDTLDACADRVVEILSDKTMHKEMVEKNFDIAKAHFSYDNAWEVFKGFFKKHNQ